MRPQDVVAPRLRWQMIDVIWDGKERGTRWSMAVGRWKNDEDDHWRPVLAQRWDGPPDGIGMPVSTGHPVWFVVPGETYQVLVDSEFVPPEKRSFVKTILGLHETGRTAA